MTYAALLFDLVLSDIEAIGYACSQVVDDGMMCHGIAVGVVHWPSGSIRCCEQHVAAWTRIGEAMGITNLQVTPLPVRRKLTFVDDLSVRVEMLEIE